MLHVQASEGELDRRSSKAPKPQGLLLSCWVGEWVEGRKELLEGWGFPNTCGCLLLSDSTSEKETAGETQPVWGHLLWP